ncbi:cell surface protein SprA [Prevotella sp. OH937_COT-195]|uniref:T9SS outer membrane translocon Sov/SprA n=1 Tax=Prevotella sp. OH937_COT-195 TaxID=2491051 RepID=UPI000F6523A8|nr:cell surface protein SprA [Prevotella sp. OH937_COT-195]RRD02361.1 cell surface protein SprA [Prevotella sp. OH937_COT-195]
MNNLKKIYILLLATVSINMLAWNVAPLLQDDLTRNRDNNRRQNLPDDKNKNNAGKNNKEKEIRELVIDDEDSIPDSLLNPRWKIQRISPITFDDLNRNPTDLKLPENMRHDVVYNDTLDRYVIGSKIGDTYVNAPIMMTPEEYARWSEKLERDSFYRSKNSDILQKEGKEKFDFSDMHFDLGPAEKIFGPGGVRIKTQGTAELKFGATLKNIDNPSLPIRHRKTTTMDFDEKINLNVNGKVGDKVNMNLNYNTDATFDFDAQNIKLKYEGKEDEIIKLVEGGNVSLPSNSSLVRGASSLFGIRTDLQFGRLKLQTVLSQKKSSSKSVSSRGGVQLTPFEIDAANYEENRHFFLSFYFRDRYEASMRTLPNLTTGVTLNRIEVWVTNKTGTTTNTRNIIAMTKLAEGAPGTVPANSANNIYSDLTTMYAGARDIDMSSSVLDGTFTGGTDYEKLQSARLLNPSEYSVNQALGYISLRTALQTDQVLAVAYEYTYGGVTYQVGEFASDITDVSQALFVKSLKNTSNNPTQANWDLMMKNVYYLASSVEKDKFKLDVKFQSDTAGVYLSYIPEPQVKNQTLIKILGADRLDNNMKAHPNGYFDFVEGYTVSNGRVFLPSAEPFGSYLYNYLTRKGVDAAVASKYSFTELYDSTKTVAKQIAEKDKYILQGQFRGTSANVISLGAYNVPQGSVVVTAGGVTLTEGSDYSVDYSAGEVTILNQSIIDAGTSVNVSLESLSDYAQERKTMIGFNWQYDFSKNFQLSGTFQHLSEQALTTKVAMGSEPLNNTIWGVNLNWKHESQWLTNLLDKIPFLHCTQPSQISFNGEFAQLIAGKAKGTQDNASYLDDFENTKNSIDVSAPTSWVMSSVPTMFKEYSDKTTLAGGYNRALLSWYNIDRLFTNRSSSLTPGHIKSDLNQLSNHYVREVYVDELYPNRDQSSYSGATSTLPVLNLAFYPAERGAYNFDPQLNSDGTLPNPQRRWGGMMRKLDTNDFEAANIEYIEFWMLDPFIYTRQDGTAARHSGDLFINLGEMSEDILRDGKKFYESGMPVDGSQSFTTTQWGKIPTQSTVTYAFATTKGSRQLQDVGYNGLTNQEETSFATYQNFLNTVRQKVTGPALDSIMADPANDDYHYYRGRDLDQIEAPILKRYKRVNMPQGNSPDSDTRTESYDTSYKTTPDVEDINQDYTLNEYEKYFQYRVAIHPDSLIVGENFIVDKRETTRKLRNGNRETVNWYQFRIPIREFTSRVGNISDFSSIRFMRMFMTGFERPVVLRFGSLDLVRGEWRVYQQQLGSGGSGRMAVSAVNIEENNDKTPVNYVLPPGIRREQDPTQPQLTESNEQALAIQVNNLSNEESKAVYKNTTIDLRQYKRLQMFVHANSFENNVTNLRDNQLAVFVRLGSDYKSNYYEYLIPLKLTPAGFYDRYSVADCRAVWPEENMLDIDLRIFTNLKKARNIAKAGGTASYNREYSEYDNDRPNNRVTIMGNPTLGEIKTMIIGVRNLDQNNKSGEVWINELRLLEYNNEGGWAAQAALNLQLSDVGTVNATGKYMSEGFGGLEEGVMERSQDNYKTYSVTANIELGKLFPDKAKVSAPLYYSVTKEEKSPKYNPLDTDMRLDNALNAAGSKHERDSIESIAVTKTTNTNFSLSNVRVGIATKAHPMPYDPANFSFSYSHSHRRTSGETTVYETEDNWRGAMGYSYTPVYKPFEPFKKLIKSNSKWFDILKRFGFNWLPQNIAFNTEITRNYYELQERDMEDLSGSQLPLTFSEQFLWNRDFSIRWDITKNLHMNFQSATHAEIEEPYTPINKDLYPDRYTAWKDSVKTSLWHFGSPLDYNQSFSLSYQLPLNLIPIFNWVNADANYTSTYSWVRGTDLEDGTSLGNTISNNRNLSINGSFNMERLYNNIPFLKKTNERFNKMGNDVSKKKPSKTEKNNNESNKEKTELPKNKNTFEKEITLMPDTVITVNHGRKSKRLVVSARTSDGKIFPLKYKKVGQDQIKITSKVDSATTLKLTVYAKPSLEDKGWYKTAQCVARVLMMVRSVSLSYRNQYSMSLPGFLPNVGDFLGQRRGDIMSPGLDFAFGLTGDSYLEKAARNGWLLMNDSVATPATINNNIDLQLRMTLEPVKNLKIDLNAARTENRASSIQYMYEGRPTTRSGTFTMTTISLKSAFESIGSANSGYHSATFEHFCRSLAGFRNRIEAQYEGVPYPSNSALAGKRYSSEGTEGRLGIYSSDVLIPAFLSAYTGSGGSSLDIFPVLAKLLPNWTVRYSGLSRLPWFRDVFKSVNLNHSYKSIYSVGSYSTYSTFQEYMNGLGFINDATTSLPIPSSMYNVSSVSITESFSPLLGIDVTLQNNMTCKLEYRKTRNLSLSMTSIQLSEAYSNDWVIGMGYKINDFKLFGGRNHRKVKTPKKGGNNDKENNGSKQQNNSKGKSINHDLNLRLDISYRRQAAIVRDIATMTSSASSGNTAFKLAFNADYTLSRLLTMSFYYDCQTNTPLLTSSSYPTTTQDFGFALKFSLTR